MITKVTSLQASLRNVENGRDDTAPTSPTTGYRAERADHCEGPTQIKLKKNREAAEKTSTEEKDVKVGNKKVRKVNRFNLLFGKILNNELKLSPFVSAIN